MPTLANAFSPIADEWPTAESYKKKQAYTFHKVLVSAPLQLAGELELTLGSRFEG